MNFTGKLVTVPSPQYNSSGAHAFQRGVPPTRGLGPRSQGRNGHGSSLPSNVPIRSVFVLFPSP